MSSGVVERNNASRPEDLVEKASLDVDHSEILTKPDLMNDAFDGENREHEMGVWEAAKSHPWACFWAFLMCFTIVSRSIRPQSFLHRAGRHAKCATFCRGRCKRVLTLNQVMESFDMFLNGNFVALPAFQQKFGVLLDNGKWSIPTRWQSALFQSGQCGAFIGVFLAGPITNRFGYRWTTIMALLLMNATIFVSFFVCISQAPSNLTILR